MTTSDLTLFTAKSPEDLIALAPIVIGFQPVDSMVMLTFGGRRQFHARIDLPDPKFTETWCAELVRPAVQHGVRAVALIAYTDDEVLCRRLTAALAGAFGHSGIAVVEKLRFHRGRWFGRGAPRSGREFEPSSHPFTARAVLAGMPLRASRTDLADLVAVDSEGARLVARQLDGLDQCPWSSTEEFRSFLGGLADRGEVTSQEVAQVLLAIDDDDLRRAAWAGLDRERCRAMLEVWISIMRRVPCEEPTRLAMVAGVAGVLAWRSGEGALAWCVLDRLGAGPTEFELVELVRTALLEALDPALLDSQAVGW